MSGVPRAAAAPAEAKKAAAAINAFGLDLLRSAGKPGANVVLSPTSIAIALAMARAGARGETAAQMDTVLRSAGADKLAAAGEERVARSIVIAHMSVQDLPVLSVSHSPIVWWIRSSIPAGVRITVAQPGIAP